MNRLVSLLLIPMFMLGQPLPHSHAGACVDQADDHASRPHVHFAQHDHHHGHSHAERESETDYHRDDSGVADAADDIAAIFGMNGHDDDAFYLANSTPSHHRLSIGGEQNHFAVVPFNVPEHLGCRPMSGPQILVPLQRRSSLPIYLLTASLRL
ncbi:hypothetical protein [Rubripirellula reticaptiva]|uniref:Uncharacterized protein n=1 Tax=Rubripirellula reticaptiva TaxID=2528013 RepID=A0A5C6EC57_9BACT|nr:hypothetical protein [Rubripirellula reticaptiva]TWU46572.1 hypothetical protein Poly59_55450 [Rubripirellula reticaptiva]